MRATYTILYLIALLMAVLSIAWSLHNDNNGWMVPLVTIIFLTFAMLQKGD